VATKEVTVQASGGDLRVYEDAIPLADFVQRGVIAWPAGTYKDSSWRAGSISAADVLDRFLAAAADLVANPPNQ
jgi:hypothetical protein